MRIISISDTHSQHEKLKLPETDILIHSGDITFFSKKGLQEVVDFLDWFHKQPAKYKIFCAGNHDLIMEAEEKYIRKILPSGVTYLNDEMVEIEGIKIWGSPITPYFYGWAFNRMRGPEIQKHWDKIPEGIDILVTHGPPKGVLDIVSGENVGCIDLLNAIKRVKPSICTFGHIHVTYGKTVLKVDDKEIQCYNSALVNQNYEIVNKPHIFTFDK